MNGFNNTKCSGGMYSHAKHIWARHLSLSFYQTAIRLWNQHWNGVFWNQDGNM